MKKVVILLLVTVALGVAYWLGKKQTMEIPPKGSTEPSVAEASPIVSPTPAETDSDITSAIKIALGSKYNKQPDDFVVTLSSKDESHAKGMVNLKGEMGGGIWFGAKTSKGWELAFDGNGIIDCAIVTKFDFSKTMIPSCVDLEHGGAVLER